jgi:hypothetical protein
MGQPHFWTDAGAGTIRPLRGPDVATVARIKALPSNIMRVADEPLPPPLEITVVADDDGSLHKLALGENEPIWFGETRTLTIMGQKKTIQGEELSRLAGAIRLQKSQNAMINAKTKGAL